MDMAHALRRAERTTGHNGKNDFSMADDGRLTRYRDAQYNGVVYAGCVRHEPVPSLTMHRTMRSTSTSISTRRSPGGRLHGTMLDGHWLTVGALEAIGEAERRSDLPGVCVTGWRADTGSAS